MFTRPRKAATVAILKNNPNKDEGFEVLLLKRHANDVFLPSYYVFPGGAVDEQDNLSQNEHHAEYSLSIPRGINIDFDFFLYSMAAIRETFEESGFLLARDFRGKFIRIESQDEIKKYSGYRNDVYNNKISFSDMLAKENLQPAIDSVFYISRWITPVFSPIRYDTRFFAAQAPEKQYIMHDGIELVETKWMEPADALDQHKKNKMKMVLPTIKTLQLLTKFKKGSEFIDHLKEKNNLKN